jgi:hypothetical protein
MCILEKKIKHKLKKLRNSGFSTILEKNVIILTIVDFLGCFGLVGKLINSTTNLDKETFVLPKICELEFELKIAF